MQALNNVNFYFQANEVGTLPQAVLNDVPWVRSSLPQEATAGPGGRDVSGGWPTWGAAYSTKVTIPNAFAVTMMAWSLLKSPPPPSILPIPLTFPPPQVWMSSSDITCSFLSSPKLGQPNAE